MIPPATALIIGCGDIGTRIALALQAQGAAVTGLVRRADAAAALHAQGIAAICANLDAPLPALPATEAVFYCAPPPGEGTGDPRLTAVLRVLPPPAQGVVYVSTTAVYGDCAGRWVDESEPLKPGSARGQRRVAAETALHDWAARTGGRTLVLRVPGIYGPGRLPLARLQNGEPVLRAADSPFTNRIHADDLAAAALCVLARGAAGTAYNVADEHPTTMTDYLRRCAALLGLPAPPEVPIAEARARFSPMLLSFLEESKRIRCTRLRALGWQPRWVDLEAGLPGCLPVSA